MNELKITGIPDDLKEDLKFIAKDLGVTLSSYLKPQLRKLTEEYYEKYPDRKGRHK